MEEICKRWNGGGVEIERYWENVVEPTFSLFFFLFDKPHFKFFILSLLLSFIVIFIKKTYLSIPFSLFTK